MNRTEAVFRIPLSLLDHLRFPLLCERAEDTCKAIGGAYVCTRERGHETMPHVAHIPNGTPVAYWYDERQSER